VNRNAVALCLSCCALATSSFARADEAPVREYIVDERLPPASTRWKVIVGGLATTAAFYAVAQPFSYVWPDSPGSRDLRYPVAGPWLSLANNGCPSGESCSTVWLIIRGVLKGIDGIGQAGGLAVAMEGIFMNTSRDAEFEPGAPRKPKPRPQPTAPEQPAGPGNLFYVPRPMMVGQSGVGLGLWGAF
jgi:hypothetical protein